MNKISVIIPVYNVENYLSECLDSVLNQTYKDYEIILVDDGSIDSSGTICDQYASKYKNIKVIHKDNGGLSSARNTGVEQSSGEFVTFVDSDDLITNDYLSILYKGISKYNADVSCGNFYLRFKGDHLLNIPRDSIKYKTYSGKKACKYLLYGKMFNSSSCCMLIRKSIAVNNEFPIGKFHEDEFTTFKFLLSSNVVTMSSCKIYYYRSDNVSITRSTDSGSIVDKKKAADNYATYFPNGHELNKASINKKYSIYFDIVKNDICQHVISKNLLSEINDFLITNSTTVLLDINTSFYLRKTAFKLLFHKN